MGGDKNALAHIIHSKMKHTPQPSKEDGKYPNKTHRVKTKSLFVRANRMYIIRHKVKHVNS